MPNNKETAPKLNQIIISVSGKENKEKRETIETEGCLNFSAVPLVRGTPTFSLLDFRSRFLGGVCILRHVTGRDLEEDTQIVTKKYFFVTN